MCAGSGARYFSGGPAMPAYRIHWLDRDDRVTEADYLIAEVDDVREGAGLHLRMASAVEVWHGVRRVVRVSANSPIDGGVRGRADRPHKQAIPTG